MDVLLQKLQQIILAAKWLYSAAFKNVLQPAVTNFAFPSGRFVFYGAILLHIIDLFY